MDRLQQTLNFLELAAEATLAPDERALLRCRLAKRLENSGEYEAALELLRPFWPGPGGSPEVDGLGARAAAELFLRAGVLTGWLGSKAAAAGSQEAAKDLISRGLSLFEEAGPEGKADEARVELAYCYFREGALDEARVILREALKRLGDEQEAKTVALLRLAAVEGAATRFSDSLKILLDAAPLFGASENQALKGGYHNHLAHAFHGLGTAENRADYFDRAIVEFTAAGYHFEMAGHARYQAHVENNLGLLLHSLGRFEEAHEHLGRARRIFNSLGDNLYAAQVDETTARVLLEQGRTAAAEEVSGRAVETFECVGALNLLAEALTTRGKALARLGRPGEARAEWERAASAGEQAGSLEVAGLAVLTMCEEAARLLRPDELREAYVRADRLLSDSQSPEILARLRQVARQALDSFSTKEGLSGRVARFGAAEADAPGVGVPTAEQLVADAVQHYGKDVTFTPEALAAMNLLFLSDGVLTLSRLIEQSVSTAPPGAVVSADDVEIVTMRPRDSRGTLTQPWAEFSLKEALGSPEKRFIELALKAADGKISVAARLLGLDHNEKLTSIIKSRYPELLSARLPPIPRRRSIIRKPRH